MSAYAYRRHNAVIVCLVLTNVLISIDILTGEEEFYWYKRAVKKYEQIGE